ncbi:hypothetical protein ALQ33_03461 [Pseudomonas syringae pv. philadelphi]|uniref:Uncharacterized protein n=3 Tax=Pseudomonas syringae group TaxID=136849 RepID=A0A9X0H5G7_PSESX|nr:hypothetical protein [Pseudomonas syringae]KPX14427.1 Unknown protein sequence [Pseudomonas syringae pv. daphniphylli]RMO95935.1 hypothetical protein ALQ33_03461 [Pseudomonas syringae pv. philadelphi]GFZ61498.1 hypothetical protein PSE10A_40090 [Pseudomonas amygdali pv. eriobotryae]
MAVEEYRDRTPDRAGKAAIAPEGLMADGSGCVSNPEQDLANLPPPKDSNAAFGRLDYNHTHWAYDTSRV